MSTPPPLAFPDYDPRSAATLRGGGVGVNGGGLPGYLRIEIVDVGPGHLVAELPVTADLLNPFGTAHGGVVSALVDHVLGAVCLPVIQSGAWPATSEYKLNMIAPARMGIMRAEADILALSKRTAVVRIDVTNEDRLIAGAQGTVAIMPPREDASKPAPGPGSVAQSSRSDPSGARGR